MVERLDAPTALAEAAAARGWELEVLRGGAAALHGEAVRATRTVRVNLVSAPALVLGSSQQTPARPALGGADLAVRRSGGGAVWLEPGAQVWVDVVIPRDDAQFDEDVGRSSLWLGAAWAHCVDAGAEVWNDRMQHRESGALACFAGVGSGEVLLGGSKVVGISQRRTRELARFQSVAYLRWDPTQLIAALECPAEVRGRLENNVSTLPMRGDQWDVVECLLSALP